MLQGSLPGDGISVGVDKLSTTHAGDRRDKSHIKPKNDFISPNTSNKNEENPQGQIKWSVEGQIQQCVEGQINNLLKVK